VDSVRVTAAPYNGTTWTANPFDPMAPWIAEAARMGRIKPKGCDREHAAFEVVTPAGTVLALPGDRIERAVSGILSVVRAHEAKSVPATARAG
jgi:hypothetical protein